jgi:ATP-dependent DNA helicase PIF1
VIDEISMLASYYFEMINHIFQLARKNNDIFGGVQLIATGDFLQLPPISANFCFESDLWDSIHFQNIYLKKLYRFTDQKYSEILSRVRVCKNTTEDNSEIIKRYYAYQDLFDEEGKKYDELKIKPTFLFSKKINVEEKNITELDSVCADQYDFMSVDTFTNTSEIDILDILAPRKISYKVGCQVMLNVNIDVENFLCNGARGVITGIKKNEITVLLKDGRELPFTRYEYQYIFDDKVIATRMQFPFILAYALSIHKCQGSTIDCAVIDLGYSIFEASQAYVALSRVRSLDSLYVKSFQANKIFCNENVLRFYEQLEENPDTIIFS